VIEPGYPFQSGQFHRLRGFPRLEKRHKSGLNGGHHGSGATNQIAIEMLVQQAGAIIVQVPYKGGTPSTIALLSGEVDFVFSTMTTVVPYLQSGRLRGLAVSTK